MINFILWKIYREKINVIHLKNFSRYLIIYFDIINFLEILREL